jgi:hypothetical protein
MKLNTGKVAFDIEFDNGDSQKIFFNPNDPDLAVRMMDFQGKVESRTKELENLKLKPDGTPEDVEAIERFRSIRNIICEELDRAFNGDISSVVFKHCSPFAIVGGDYFIMQFIEAIKPEIEKHIKQANQAVEQTMQKHIANYIKK